MSAAYWAAKTKWQRRCMCMPIDKKGMKKRYGKKRKGSKKY